MMRLSLLLIGLLVELMACRASTEQPVPPTPSAIVVTAAMPTLDVPLSLPTETITHETEPTAIPTTSPTETACIFEPDGVAPAVEGRLRVVFQEGDEFGIWREEMGTTERIGFPAGAREPKISDDAQLVAYQRARDEQEMELWVWPLAGGEPRLLLTASGAETMSRYPNAVGVNFGFYWVPNTHTLAYNFHPVFDALGGVPSEALRLVDADTGATRAITPSGEVNALTFAPDGSQLAALTAQELRLIRTQDGSVQAAIPLQLAAVPDQTMEYSPDGRTLVVFATSQIALVDVTDGSHRVIPFQYRAIGRGHYRVTPPVYWLDGEPAFLTWVADSDSVDNFTDTFTIWQINTAEATTEPLRRFTGFILSADLSPDQRTLAFYVQGGNHRKLYLADIQSGEQVLYDEGPLIEFRGWHPDSTRFLYWFAEERQPYLGHLCQPPHPFGPAEQPGIASGYVQWVDGDRYLEHRFDAAGNPTEIRLRSLAGDDVLIASGRPVFQFFSLDPEP